MFPSIVRLLLRNRLASAPAFLIVAEEYGMRFDIEREIRRRHRRCVKWWRLSAGVLALNRISFASELACVYARAVPQYP
jgi:hypothetical protein